MMSRFDDLVVLIQELPEEMDNVVVLPVPDSDSDTDTEKEDE